MTFKLEIATDNEAFDPYPGVEVARILRELSDKIECDRLHVGASYRLSDVNGNRVGEARVTR